MKTGAQREKGERHQSAHRHFAEAVCSTTPHADTFWTNSGMGDAMKTSKSSRGSNPGNGKLLRAWLKPEVGKESRKP